MLYKAIVETMVCNGVRDFGIPIPFRDLLVQFIAVVVVDYRASIRIRYS